ncbi:MAG: helix-hairpin-helix domain-containing protein, partial [Chlamydiota bacterium]|nr:helix-hairpin-helix domain-containing protein [Chlamydiota bacterium]
WSGREGDGWDFVFYNSKILEGNRLSFNYTGQHIASGKMGTGKLIVTFFGHHIKAELLDNTGNLKRGYDGTLSKDGTMISGSSWPIPSSGPEGPKRYGWWATIEKKLPLKAQDKISINMASVADLESLGLSSRSARTLIEGRVLGGTYTSIEDLYAAPRLSEEEKTILEKHVVLQ